MMTRSAEYPRAPPSRGRHDLEPGAADELEFLLAVRPADALHLAGQPRDVLEHLDDAAEHLEGDLAGLGGGEDEPLVPQEQAGEDAEPEQVRLAVLPADEHAGGAVLPPAVVVDDVRAVGDVLLPREQRLAEGFGEFDEVSAP